MAVLSAVAKQSITVHGPFCHICSVIATQANVEKSGHKRAGNKSCRRLIYPTVQVCNTVFCDVPRTDHMGLTI